MGPHQLRYLAEHQVPLNSFGSCIVCSVEICVQSRRTQDIPMVGERQAF